MLLFGGCLKDAVCGTKCVPGAGLCGFVSYALIPVCSPLPACGWRCGLSTGFASTFAHYHLPHCDGNGVLPLWNLKVK